MAKELSQGYGSILKFFERSLLLLFKRIKALVKFAERKLQLLLHGLKIEMLNQQLKLPIQIFFYSCTLIG